MMIREIIAAIFLLAGLAFCVTTIVGMYRFPDFYARCHASGNSETLGLTLICVGFIIYSGFTPISIKLVIVFLIVYACNPVGGHVLARSAYQNGFPMTLMYRKEENDADTAD